MRAFITAAALLACAAPARADIVLPGAQHIGDAERPEFTPRDPVRRAEMRSNPTRFHLSQTTVITAVRLENPVDLDGRLQVYIDDMTTPRPGALAGNTYTLAAPLTLPAGIHTLWPDGGCSNGAFATTCSGGENDFGFSGITLVSAQIGASRSHHQRRHLGSSNEGDNNYAGRYYPDSGEGDSLGISFTPEVSRLLAEVRFYRLRDVGNAAPSWATVTLSSVEGTRTIGTLDTNGNPKILTSGLVLTGGITYTLTVAGSDDISWDDIIVILANNPATTPGAFNAVDPLGDPATGPLKTKVAGASFEVDLVALSGSSPLLSYTGSVDVTLLDAAATSGVPVPDTNCDAGWIPVATLATNVPFTASDAGRKRVALSWSNALREARLHIRDAALGVAGCSVDNFAIRPHTFANVQAKHNSPTTPGTAQSLATGAFTDPGTPTHRAGRPFTVEATAVSAAGAVTAGYNGSPVLDAAASLLGPVTGDVEAAGWVATLGALRTDLARYDEAGAVQLQITDLEFAGVDADDTDDVDRRIGPVMFNVGRFTPDHFVLTPEDPDPARIPSFMPAAGCGTFSYLGEPLTLAPVLFSITAVDASGTEVTTNYSHPDLYKLSGSLPATTFLAATGNVERLNAPAPPAPDNLLTNQGAGVSRFALQFDQVRFVRTGPTLPFEAEIALQLGALGESDGIDFLPSQNRYGQPAPGQGIPFIPAASKSTRYGRVVLDNAHGSERLPLAVPLRTEYWTEISGTPAFARNLADDCTTFVAGDVVLTTAPAGLPTTPTARPLTIAPYGDGMGAIELSAPDVPGVADVRLNLSALVLPWLRGDWDGDGDWNEDDSDPTARATFGLAAGPERRIYRREVVAD